jgi:hypothetical protein
MERPEAAPDSRWVSALRSGNFERAWQISDQALHAYCASGVPKHTGERHRQRIWRGESLHGKRVLVRCYHGLGDSIQFVRFAEPLRAIAREVILWTQPELIPLFRNVAGVDLAIPLHEGAPEVAYDVDIEIMELAHALRVTPDRIPSAVPYLPRDNGASHRQRFDSLAVALVWEAGDWDRRRCVAPEAFSPLGQIAGVRLFSLQLGPSRPMAAVIPAVDIATPDINALAATMQEVDITITVDTMTAHLGGALGLPVWTVLHSECDWRWPASADRTPWYPTMKLFHQRVAGDWTGVIAEIGDELKRRVEEELRDADGSIGADGSIRACAS